MVGGIAQDSTASSTGVDTTIDSASVSTADVGGDAVRIVQQPEGGDDGSVGAEGGDEEMAGSPEWPQDPLDDDEE